MAFSVWNKFAGFLMIGSFWNLCRTCPSMPVDKVRDLQCVVTSTWSLYYSIYVKCLPLRPSITVHVSACIMFVKKIGKWDLWFGNNVYWQCEDLLQAMEYSVWPNDEFTSGAQADVSSDDNVIIFRAVNSPNKVLQAKLQVLCYCHFVLCSCIVPALRNVYNSMASGRIFWVKIRVNIFKIDCVVKWFKLNIPCCSAS